MREVVRGIEDRWVMTGTRRWALGGLTESSMRSSKATSISAVSTGREAYSPSEISFTAQCSSPRKPPLSRICIHRRRMCAKIPSLAVSIC